MLIPFAIDPPIGERTGAGPPRLAAMTAATWTMAARGPALWLSRSRGAAIRRRRERQWKAPVAGRRPGR